MPWTIELPYPPSVNGYWRHITIDGKPRTLVSSSGRKYQTDVTASVLLAGRPATFKGRLKIDVVLHPPTLHKRDIDNPIKALFDALVKAMVMEDDSQIDEFRVVRGKVRKLGLAVVTIAEIN